MALPPLRSLLGLSRISLMDGLVISAGSTIPLLANEMYKAAREKTIADTDVQEDTDADRNAGASPLNGQAAKVVPRARETAGEKIIQFSN